MTVDIPSGLHVDRRDDGVAIVTLDRPERRNALTDELLEVLPRVFDDLRSHGAVRAVVITGSGVSFCAGADLDECAGFTQSTTAGAAEQYVRGVQQAVVALRRLDKPSIAAINGAAIGAGLGLALACDIRLAAPGAFMAAPFVGMGLVPDFGITYHLPRLIGVPATLELLLTGRTVDAAEAVGFGLVSRVEQDVVTAACALAGTIASMPPRAVAATRANVYRSLALDFETEVLWQEPATIAIAMTDPEFAQRVAKYRERRFRGS